jgi:hypothetical protein
LTRVFSRIFLVGGFQSPQVPSWSPPSLSIRSRKVTPEWSLCVTTDRYSGPIGRLWKCTANGACSLLATITFLASNWTPPTPPRAAATVSGRRGPAATQSRTDRRFGVAWEPVTRTRGREYAWLRVGRLASDFCARSARPGAVSLANQGPYGASGDRRSGPLAGV